MSVKMSLRPLLCRARRCKGACAVRHDDVAGRAASISWPGTHLLLHTVWYASCCMAVAPTAALPAGPFRVLRCVNPHKLVPPCCGSFMAHTGRPQLFRLEVRRPFSHENTCRGTSEARVLTAPTGARRVRHDADVRLSMHAKVQRRSRHALSQLRHPGNRGICGTGVV